MTLKIFSVCPVDWPLGENFLKLILGYKSLKSVALSFKKKILKIPSAIVKDTNLIEYFVWWLPHSVSHRPEFWLSSDPGLTWRFSFLSGINPVLVEWSSHIPSRYLILSTGLARRDIWQCVWLGGPKNSALVLNHF